MECYKQRKKMLMTMNPWAKIMLICSSLQLWRIIRSMKRVFVVNPKMNTKILKSCHLCYQPKFLPISCPWESAHSLDNVKRVLCIEGKESYPQKIWTSKLVWLEMASSNKCCRSIFRVREDDIISNKPNPSDPSLMIPICLSI